MINVYRTSDEKWFWLLGVEADRLWPKLLAAIDRKEWGDDDRFRTARDRRYNCEALIALLDALFATKTRDEWTALFDEHDVWWAPVNTADDVIADPQAIAAGAFVDVPAAAGSDAHRAVASPVRFGADDAGAHRRGVPALGEHTEEVLRELLDFCVCRSRRAVVVSRRSQKRGGRFSCQAATPSRKSASVAMRSSNRSDSATALPTSPWRSA